MAAGKGSTCTSPSRRAGDRRAARRSGTGSAGRAGPNPGAGAVPRVGVHPVLRRGAGGRAVRGVAGGVGRLVAAGGVGGGADGLAAAVAAALDRPRARRVGAVRGRAGHDERGRSTSPSRISRWARRWPSSSSDRSRSRRRPGTAGATGWASRWRRWVWCCWPACNWRAGSPPTSSIGLVAIFASAAAWAGYIVLGRRIAVRRDGISSLAVGMTAGALLYSPLAIGAVAPVVTELSLAVVDRRDRRAEFGDPVRHRAGRAAPGERGEVRDPAGAAAGDGGRRRGGVPRSAARRRSRCSGMALVCVAIVLSADRSGATDGPERRRRRPTVRAAAGRRPSLSAVNVSRGCWCQRCCRRPGFRTGSR